MSYNNYYQSGRSVRPAIYKNQSVSIDWLLSIAIGLVLTVLVVSIWYIWALNYRYSTDRINNKMMSKYKKLDGDRFLYVTDGSVNPERTMASAKMNQRKKATGDYISSEILTLPILEECLSSVNTCVKL